MDLISDYRDRRKGAKARGFGPGAGLALVAAALLASGCGTRAGPEPAPAAEAAPAVQPAAAETAPVPQPAAAGLKPRPAWKPGDIWQISLELFPRDGMGPKGKAATPKGPPTPVARYAINVCTLSTHAVEGVSCWKLEFVLVPGSPASLRPPCFVFVGTQDGWPRRVDRKGEPDANRIETFGDARFLTTAQRGVPLEIFPPFEPGETKSATSPRVLHLRREVTDKGLVLEAALTGPQGEELRVRQVWVPGERWWRSYERHVRGRLDLRARLVNVPRTAAEIAAAAKAAPKFSPLSRDRRLLVPVTLVKEHATLADALGVLRQATGLSLTVDPGLADYQPDLGSMQLRKAQAFALMDLLAGFELEEGRWVADGRGYRLVGRRKGLPGVEPPAVVPAAALSPWLIGSGSFLAGVVLTLVLVFVLGKRAAPGGRRRVTPARKQMPQASGGHK